MQRSLVAALIVLVMAIPLAISGTLLHGYAQVAGPQGDEFNTTNFAAPFVVKCASFAPSCPDSQSTTTTSTWSLDAESPGNLRIWTQVGSLLGTSANASNNARNLVLQPFNPLFDWTVTTSLHFPAIFTNSSPLGQTAGLLVYQDDDNFLFVGRVFNTGTSSALEFVQEIGGVDTVSTVPETNATLLTNNVYLRIMKTGTVYQAFYSYDNINFTAIAPGSAATATAVATATGTVTATATAVPTATPSVGYTASYTSPSVGVFAFGGTNAAVTASLLPADFDWFRVGNSATPGPSPVPTGTATVTTTAIPTSTALPTSTAISSVTATPVGTVSATSTAVATATTVPTPTNTPIPPTPTPTPIKKKKYVLSFKSVSVWYHAVRRGTFEHLEVQANHHSKLGIWVHVIFPTGLHYDYYENTNGSGHWSKSFTVPKNALNSNTNRAIVAMQLWHAKTTVKDFEFFTVI